MKTKKTILSAISALSLALTTGAFAQVPVANFSINPNPVCTGAVVQITDLSTGSPASWSYTLSQGGPGIGPPQLSTSQNPTVAYNNPGTYTISLIATNASGASALINHTISVLASPNAFLNPANQTSCVGGNPITLNVNSNGTNTYSWSTGASTQSISVSPSVTTNYTCVVTGTNGCYAARTATVIISQPTINIGSVPASICPGSSSTLTATGSNPGPWTYTWSTSAATRTISTNVAGVYNVTVTNSNGCSGVQSYTLGTSSVLSLTANSTPTALCAGNTATLHVTGASSYTWSNGASTANQTVNPTSSITYTVSGVLGACSGTAAITLNVSVTPTITISSSSSSVCSGNAINLAANGATNYTWTPSGITTASISVTPSVSSTYTVRGSNPGCPIRTSTISVSVVPSPTVSISSSASLICAGEDLAISASGAASYSWNNGSSNAIILVNPTVTTTYSVIGTAANGCTNTAQIIQNVNACTGISTQLNQPSQVSIFPNPNNGNFTLKTAETMNIRVLNQTGQLIKETSLNENNGYQVNINDLSTGIYFVIGQNTSGIIKQKIVVYK